MMLDMERCGVMHSAREIEMPLIPLLAGMEVSGIEVKPNELAKQLPYINQELNRLNTLAEQCTGHRFNIASAEQVSVFCCVHKQFGCLNTIIIIIVIVFFSSKHQKLSYIYNLITFHTYHNNLLL